MAILPGRRLGPYEILSAIGAGGMGEVYKARDTRLERIVAIKVLPAHLADHAELRERFDREAKTIASLNHPHICTLYDTGHQDDADFLVMEYLEGETLAQRLQKSSLPLEQVLQYAIEISDALDKAHRKGVTHRDLKPGNIMLTKAGTKLLDFGLAKLKQEAAPANAQLTELPTAKDPLTAQGTILGTMQYMAPEQVEGKEVDARTDIFAFGVVVYEMATGKKCFEGKSQASLIAKILEIDPPPISSLQPMTPPALDRVMKKCLSKEPDSRWQTAKDLCDELKWIEEGGSQFASAPPLPRAISRLSVTLPPGQQLAGLINGLAVALSPDGTHLAYVARQGGIQQIYLRAMDNVEPRPIPGTVGAINPFFSDDGQWLGFFAGSKLKKVYVNGGAALSLADAPVPGGASWSSQGKIAFAPNAAGALFQVPEAGGIPQPLTRFAKGESNHGWPEFLPGGNALFFVAGTTATNWTNGQIAVQSLGTGERRNLLQGVTQPRYASTGHLIYAQGGTLMAVPFDPERLSATGAAVPVLEGILQSSFSGATQYSFSLTGSLAYISGGILSAAQSRLVWVGRDGAEKNSAAPVRAYLAPRLSPDGLRIAVGIFEQESQTWLYDLSRETLTRFTFGGTANINPVWSPDGKRIVFQSNRAGPFNLFWQLADGSGGLERLTTSKYLHGAHSWSADGQFLTFIEVNPSTGLDIWILRLGDKKPQPFLRTRFNEAAPRLSSDGNWLAYMSDESGRYEIYVQPYPGPGGKWQISTEGGSEPVWNPNGGELFYRNGDKMMAVDITTQPGFAAGTPKLLFEGRYATGPFPIANYDVSPDGQRFLMLKAAEQAEAAPTQINVVLNWFEELKQKVPVGKK
jgi:Tol biopolymer transport system component/predicted Ser/Thr protein kinase